MAQIMAIDYGKKRTGIAVTDDLQIIASGLDTVLTADIWKFLVPYLKENKVETFLVGDPKDLQGRDTDITQSANLFCEKLGKTFPKVQVERWDERFTSKMAFQSMLDGGMKKKDRRNKGNVDRISATLMLQEFLQYR